MVVDRSGLRAKEHKAKFSPCVWLKHLYPLVKIIHCKYIYIYLRFRGPRVQISLRVRLKCNENVLENQQAANLPLQRCNTLDASSNGTSCAL